MRQEWLQNLARVSQKRLKWNYFSSIFYRSQAHVEHTGGMSARPDSIAYTNSVPFILLSIL